MIEVGEFRSGVGLVDVEGPEGHGEDGGGEGEEDREAEPREGPPRLALLAPSLGDVGGESAAEAAVARLPLGDVIRRAGEPAREGELAVVAGRDHVFLAHHGGARSSVWIAGIMNTIT